MIKSAPKMVLVSYELGPFEFQCEGCKAIVKRSMWSVAHYDTPHTFTCDCGYVTDVVSRLNGDDYE